jgi:competence protein ComEC
LSRIEVREVCLNKQNWQPATGRIAVTTTGSLTNLFGGQRVEVNGVGALPRSAVADGTFDYRNYLSQQGIYYQLQAGSEEDWKILHSPAKRPLADRFSAWARQALGRGLPVEDESLRLEWALTLGWKPVLTEEVAEPFVRAATYHIFAVDGLRMAIVFGIFFTVLRVLRLPRAFCGVILIPLVWFYVALTGWPASAIRAAVMLSVVIAGWALKRPGEVLNSLFVAAMLILVWEPQQLFLAGFQLSFFVVLCLILILPPLYALVKRLTAPDPLLPPSLHQRWPGILQTPARYTTDLLLTSFAAWVGSIPLVAYYFHIITPVSTPANLVAVPLCALVLITNLISLLATSWFPALAILCNHAGWFFMETIRVSSNWFADWPGAYFYVPAPRLFTSVLYYGILFGVLTGWLFRSGWRKWKWAAVATAVLAWSTDVWWESGVTRLTILAADGGSAIYCDQPGKRDDLLIDAGTTNSVQFATKNFLRAQGVTRLPTMLLTHGDLHHIGGAELIVQLFSPKQVCASPIRFRSASYRATMQHFSARTNFVCFVNLRDQLGPWTVLWPDSEKTFPKADDNAVVLRGCFRGTRVLLLSDLGREGQRALLEHTADLHADIVVSGLPTEGEPLCEELVDAIQPRIIVIADLEIPVSERARPKLRDRLALRNVPVLYTRFGGVTTIECRRPGWRISTMSGLTLDDRNARALLKPSIPANQPDS